MGSGRWFLIWSYSRRPCFGGLGLSVGGSFAALGLVVGGFLQAALVFFGPVPTFLGSGKVCWKVILLGESAGEPSVPYTVSPKEGVYPRACGGTDSGICRQLGRAGLSPRLRGNLKRLGFRLVRKGSIPAPAGEPTLEFNAQDELAVYPRACGGTVSMSIYTSSMADLSPRLRGRAIAS